MSAPSPTYNLKAVVLETGIKPHTLRAWEQRYGLPRPQRTEGNHRTYTQKDIDLVKWLMLRQEEGMTISRAIELWHHLEGKAEDLLKSTVYQTVVSPLISPAENALANIRQKWLDCCLKFDKAGADHVLTQAFAIYPVQMVCLEILQKGLAQVGDLWFQNAATVQQEHFVSALIIERLNALLAATPPPTRLGCILVFCPPYEEHTIALLLLSLLLRYRGWDVVYLGASVPINQLESTIEIVKPQLVISSAQRLQTAASLAKLTQFLKDKSINTAFGGSIFNLIPGLSPQIGGHFLGETLEDAVAVVGQIMAFDPPMTKVQPLPEGYAQAALNFRAKLRQIEYDAMRRLEDETVLYEYLDKTNSRLAQDILAALSLGSMNFLTIEMKLLQQLIGNYGIPVEWQATYFEAYFQAVQANLNSEGSPIIEWLDRVRTDLNSGLGSLKSSQGTNQRSQATIIKEGNPNNKPDKAENWGQGRVRNREWSNMAM